MKDDYKPEYLGSVFVRGGLHAVFPTALRTLCLIECTPRGEMMTLPPDCLECQRVVYEWSLIVPRVSGIPRDWLPVAK